MAETPSGKVQEGNGSPGVRGGEPRVDIECELRDIKDTLSDFAEKAGEGFKEVLKALDEIFGGPIDNERGSVGGGDEFDEKVFEKVKPHFEAMWNSFKAAVRSLVLRR